MRRGSAIAAAAAALALALSGGAASTASAAQPSTPDVSVVLVNPASTGVQLAVTAHSDGDGADHASLTYRNGDVVLKGLDLHRLWVPGLGDHDHEAAIAAAEEPDHSCTDDEAGVVKVRGLSTQRGVGQVQVWIDVRPGHEGTEMIRIRVREKTGCDGHDDTGHTEPGHGDTGHEESGHTEPGPDGTDHDDADHSDHDDGSHDDGGHSGDHGPWTHNSGWIPLHVANVQTHGQA